MEGMGGREARRVGSVGDNRSAPGVEGQPGVRASPLKEAMDPRCTPEGGRYLTMTSAEGGVMSAGEGGGW